MAYTRGPGRVQIEIEGPGVTVVLKAGELRVIIQRTEGPAIIEICKPTYLFLQAWTREFDMFLEEAPPR